MSPNLPPDSADSFPQPLITPMRVMLFTAFLLVLGAGLDLFLFPNSTATMFAWHIQPPITAAFLGANYLAAGVVEFSAARQRLWAGARFVVPAVLLFTTLTAFLTLWNITDYNLMNVMAWIWIVFYFGVPPVLGFLWWKQRKAAGGEPRQEAALPRALLSAMQLAGACMIGSGLGLILVPKLAATLWPWWLAVRGYGTGEFSMQTYVAAWLLAWGTVMLNAAMENDLKRIRYIFTAFIVLALLQSVVAFRFESAIHRDYTSGLYFAGLAGLAVIGIWGHVAAAKATTPATTTWE